MPLSRDQLMSRARAYHKEHPQGKWPQALKHVAAEARKEMGEKPVQHRRRHPRRK